MLSSVLGKCISFIVHVVNEKENLKVMFLFRISLAYVCSKHLVIFYHLTRMCVWKETAIAATLLSFLVSLTLLICQKCYKKYIQLVKKTSISSKLIILIGIASRSLINFIFLRYISNQRQKHRMFRFITKWLWLIVRFFDCHLVGGLFGKGHGYVRDCTYFKAFPISLMLALIHTFWDLI